MSILYCCSFSLIISCRLCDRSGSNQSLCHSRRGVFVVTPFKTARRRNANEHAATYSMCVCIHECVWSTSTGKYKCDRKRWSAIAVQNTDGYISCGWGHMWGHTFSQSQVYKYILLISLNMKKVLTTCRRKRIKQQ